jgi:hypothetical protein
MRGLFAAAIAFAALCGTAQARSLGAAWAPEDPPVALDALPQGALVRAPIPWSTVEPRPGRFRWGVANTVVKPIVDRGLRPLLVLGEPPAWAKPDRALRAWWDPCYPGELCPPGIFDDAYRGKASGQPRWGGVPDLGAWREYVRAVAERYPSATLQVWNEPNIALFGLVSPRGYKSLLRVAVDEVGRERIIGAGLCPTEATGRKRSDHRRYARTLRRLRITRVDRDVAIHAFPGYIGGVGTIRASRRAYGPRARLWVTELGVSNAKRNSPLDDTGERWQARAMLRVLRKTRRWLEAAIIWRLNDHPDGAFWGDQSMGLLRSNLTPKPVLGAVRRAAR